MPRVSVVTGYYNRAECVEETIRSILNQSFCDLELIAFDDCSTDGTGERLLALCRELADPRFRVVIHAENRGFTRGMVDAIATASGEYICVQGSGDVSLPKRVARQVELLDARPEVGVVGCWYNNVVSTSGARRPRRPSADGMRYEDMVAGNVFSHGEVMMRRSAYEQAGGYRVTFKSAQDYDLWLRISKIARLATVPEFLYDRYVRFDGVSYEPRKFAIQARYVLLARRLSTLPDLEAAEVLRRLESEGPMALVPLKDRALQRQFVKAALRSIAFGGSQEAEILIRENIVGGLTRKALLLLAKVYCLPVAAPVRGTVSSVLGIR